MSSPVIASPAVATSSAAAAAASSAGPAGLAEFQVIRDAISGYSKQVYGRTYSGSHRTFAEKLDMIFSDEPEGPRQPSPEACKAIANAFVSICMMPGDKQLDRLYKVRALIETYYEPFVLFTDIAGKAAISTRQIAAMHGLSVPAFGFIIAWMRDNLSQQDFAANIRNIAAYIEIGYQSHEKPPEAYNHRLETVSETLDLLLDDYEVRVPYDDDDDMEVVLSARAFSARGIGRFLRIMIMRGGPVSEIADYLKWAEPRKAELISVEPRVALTRGLHPDLFPAVDALLREYGFV